ncbi:MAG: type I methionyl aminopeptidase [Desulfovibrionaceae bacterium]|nr:type I methionyl aminopeptidase [Desulfovibrionaceae bacterium]
MKKYHGAFIKNEREIGCLREADRMVANILDAVGDIVRPGLKTREINELALDMCSDYKVKPAFLGYNGFPFAVCTSVNEVVVHGFPSETELKEGDIVSVDMGVEFQGFVGDAARTYPVGTVSDEARELMRVTEESLYVGIDQARVGNDVYSIGAAIQAYVEKRGFGVVRKFVGHGVGSRMHEKPEVPNFKPAVTGLTLQSGMVIAIEPMVTQGSYEVEILDDGWTAVTADGLLAAHFEHSIAITPHGPRILSISDRGLPERFASYA